MRKYFIHNGQTEKGPFDIDQLKELQIASETPVWFEGMQNWTTAGNIPELQSIINSYGLPPKFEIPLQTTTIPPTFYKPENVIYELPAKKNNTFRNVFIGIGAIGIIYLLAAIFLNANTTEAQPFNTETAVEVIDEPAVRLEYQEAEKAKVNEDITAKNREIRSNITDYVNVVTNTYSVDALGGITNLDVVIQNSTLFLLDEVFVEVTYIKENGNAFKIELVTLYNIPAKQDKSASAPDSERGLSVEVKVIGIRSKKLKLCYDNAVAPEVGNVDPFYCN